MLTRLTSSRHDAVLPASHPYALELDNAVPSGRSTMRIYLLLYWFLAASKLKRAGCDQQLLGTGDARDEASVDAKSICYTYITTILVTITTDSSDTRDETTTQLQFSVSYSFDSRLQQTQTRTPGQVGDGVSSSGGLGFPENGMSNNPGHSSITTPDPTSVTKMSDESDAFSSEVQISSATPLTNPTDTIRGDLMGTIETETSPYVGHTPSDAILGRDSTAAASSAGATPTTPGETSGMYSGGDSNIGQDNTDLRESSTPRRSGGPGDISSGFSKYRSDRKFRSSEPKASSAPKTRNVETRCRPRFRRRQPRPQPG